MTNISKNVDIKETSAITNYLKYNIEDGETPDFLSYKLYNDTRYYWMFFLINPKLHSGINAWPLSSWNFEKYINQEYDNYMWISSAVDQPLLLSDILLEKKYLSALRLTYGPDYEITDMVIKNYDHKRLGFSVKKGNDLDSNYLRLNITDLYSDLRYQELAITHDGSDLGYEWQEKTYYESLNSNDRRIFSDDIIPRASFYFNCDRVYSNIEYSNSTYEYYWYGDDEENTSRVKLNEPIGLSHWEVQSDENLSFNKLPLRTTFIEKEISLNDDKRDILVPRKEIVGQIFLKFNELIKR